MDPDLGIIKYPDKDQQYNSVADSELKIFMSNMSSYTNVRDFLFYFIFQDYFRYEKWLDPECWLPK